MSVLDEILKAYNSQGVIIQKVVSSYPMEFKLGMLVEFIYVIYWSALSAIIFSHLIILLIKVMYALYKLCFVVQKVL